jgi:AcrR family transcriptional regulator
VPTVDRRTRIQTYHHGDLRRALVDAALAALARDRSASFTLRSLARTVGVSHNAPYAHFTDKAALLAEIASLGFAELADRLREAVARTPEDPAAQMIAAAVAYVRFGVEHPAHYRLMFSAPELAGFRAPAIGERIGAAAFSVLTHVLHALHASRAPASTSPDAESVRRDALAAWSLVHGLTSLVIDDRTGLHGAGSADTVVRVEALARDAAMALLPGLGERAEKGPRSHTSRPRGDGSRVGRPRGVEPRTGKRRPQSG